MVEAGVGKLRQLIGDDRLTDLDSDVVVYVFSAMLDAHPFLDIRAEHSRSAKQRENGGDKLVHGSGGISQPRAE